VQIGHATEESLQQMKSGTIRSIQVTISVPEDILLPAVASSLCLKLASHSDYDLHHSEL
jgi:hypothetical protein